MTPCSPSPGGRLASCRPGPADKAEALGPAQRGRKKLFIRQVEVFAAYSAYDDHEIGRVIQAFEDLGKLDNTLVIYINGDNGTIAEGGPLGTPNEVAFFNGINMMPVEKQMKFYDVWGTEQTYNHQNASRLGGIIQNMVVSWPARIKDKGGLREQSFANSSCT
jgi:arylsulfatase